jgi:L-threonylcarbamoyladenylate synthase
MTKSERIPLNTLLEKSDGRNKIEHIAHAVRGGAVFIYPTETIYGLGGAWDVGGVKERILSVKRKASDNPLILIAPDRNCFSKLPVIFPHTAELLASEFWPGMLTLVLPSSSDERGIGVRVSDHPFVSELFRYLDQPIISTSANLSGEPYINDPEKIYSVFSGAIDLFIDAGPLPPSLPSTVVRIYTDGTMRMLREGAIASKDVLKFLRHKK